MTSASATDPGGSSTMWGLLVEENEGFGGQRRVWSPTIIGHMDGTREEAMKALRGRAERYTPTHPSSPRRRLLYENTDGFLLVVEGATQDFHCRFTLATLLSDSAAK
ncbi:hypothetical protein LHJ74_15370 [Streptomyces sp. N2-109]|uniref:Uncharacterized protein n=1 Tax=Streptomyces gossypii TaxID=2883101 RepID=A0ABT2JTP4_9ACTN|nr:hypothetical protein [Streptomyces gossypii]MCT2591269.1 hypothetical protein [Streptomyces gossypii]